MIESVVAAEIDAIAGIFQMQVVQRLQHDRIDGIVVRDHDDEPSPRPFDALVEAGNHSEIGAVVKITESLIMELLHDRRRAGFGVVVGNDDLKIGKGLLLYQ
jgi:hypothetical protein